MPHIRVPENLPGIRGLMAFRPEVVGPLNALVDVLLRTREGISPGERELIAAYVSSLNDCYYCQTTHGAVAAAHLGANADLVQSVKRDYKLAPISEKLKALLAIAALVQKGGKSVTADTVLIAAAFCMYNRYVDGLDTWTHRDAELYRSRGAHVARVGYTSANQELAKAPVP